MMEITETITIDGLKLRVRDVGSGDPLLLINGIGAHVGMWKQTEQDLAGRRLISFDAPGTGDSQTPLMPYTIRGLAKLIEHLLDHFQLNQVDMLGYSFGGVVAQEFALQSPNRLKRLVLVATIPGRGGIRGPLVPLMAMLTPIRYWSQTIYKNTMHLIAGNRYDSDYLQKSWEDREGNPPSWLGYSQQVWAICQWSSLSRLPQMEIPTLIVAGDSDPLIPIENAKLMASKIKGSTLRIFPGEGHYVMNDAKAISAINQFLR